MSAEAYQAHGNAGGVGNSNMHGMPVFITNYALTCA